MNSQFQPLSSETLNRQAHERLLKEASRARLAKRQERGGQNRRAPEYAPRNPRPSILEPALSAILTAAVALQIAFIVAL